MIVTNTTSADTPLPAKSNQTKTSLYRRVPVPFSTNDSKLPPISIRHLPTTIETPRQQLSCAVVPVPFPKSDLKLPPISIRQLPVTIKTSLNSANDFYVPSLYQSLNDFHVSYCTYVPLRYQSPWYFPKENYPKTSPHLKISIRQQRLLVPYVRHTKYDRRS